jgi:hypothetical protein
MLRRIPILMAFAAVAACASGGGVVLTRADMSPTYGSGELGYAAEGGGLRVVIVGEPFEVERAVFERAVTDAMAGRNWGQAVDFTTNPGPGARDAYRAVMIFNPPTGLIGERVCRTDPPEVTPRAYREDHLGLFAVFCRSEGFLTQIEGTVRGATGPDDPLFRELVGQATQALFPPKQRLRRKMD